MFFLASCGGAAGVLQPRAVLDDPPADENPEGWHITYSRLPWRVGGSCTLKGDYPGDPGYDVVLGEQSWATFALDPGADARVAAVQVLSQPPAAESLADGQPAGRFWVGLEDKGGSRWDIYGPFAAGDDPLFGDSHPLLGEPEWWWWFKGNTRVAVFASEETTFDAVVFTTRSK